MSSFAAFGLGLATRSEQTGKLLDVWFPLVGDGDDPRGAVLAGAPGGVDGPRTVEPATSGVTDDALAGVLGQLAAAQGTDRLRGTHRTLVATFIGDLAAAPVDAHDVYLRLHLLSNRLIRPHAASFEGAFGLLNNVVWTSAGPCDPETFDEVRLAAAAAGTTLRVTSVDKFPRMTDYVVPRGVRIGDADRVRLGAHLAEGTTVMHEGFVNFNAGTLGASMVEGRISAGVVVGDGSDLGGSASIMGTLSGGGGEVISVGERCLIGANAGIGVSLGDDCVVEAGLYVTAGTKVTFPDGEVVKAVTLSGADGLLFRRDSVTGAVTATPRDDTASWGGLNAALHAND